MKGEAVASDPTGFARAGGRGPKQLRPVTIETPFMRHAEGSASIRTGGTWVICSATVEDRQPPFLKGTPRGWVTAEYGMLPRAVDQRAPRGRPSGRSTEIQRLIGRSLRTVVDLQGLPEHTITIDCDVIEADGGTRTAAVTGAFVALCQACRWMIEEGRILHSPVRDQVAGIGVGIVDGEILCDLDYAEDSAAQVDMNIFMTGSGRYVGIHGTGETATFDDPQLQALLAVARQGLDELFAQQRKALGLEQAGPFDPAGTQACD
jgi:ribonuclease PH